MPDEMVVVSKLERLRVILRGLDGVVVAYSGGVDSAFLADVAHETLGARSLAATAVSPSLAPREREHAHRLAVERGWAHLEVLTREAEREAYRANAPDRCYHCKTELLEVLGPLARERGWTVAVGTNRDDLRDHRPGLRAAREHGALAPLADAGLAKDEIRALSRVRGLRTWDKPAAPCLASRVAYGVEVTPERLTRIAAAEGALQDLGLADLRVRDHGGLARIEVPAASIGLLAERETRARVVSALREVGFSYVTLDLEGFRSGSMNEPLLGISRRPAPRADATPNEGEH